MIGLDTNVLIDILVRSQPGHEPARRWLEGIRDPLVTTSINVGELLRLLTHPRVFRMPMILPDSVELFQEFVTAFGIEVLEEQEGWWSELALLGKEIPSLRGNEVFDARIALCLRHHGVKILCTLDDDFRKYPFLEIARP